MADYTPTSWAQALLQALGMPVTTANVEAITAWEAAEGGHWHNSDLYNPLNTTQPEPGAVSTNSAGVKRYTSWAQGLAATVTTLGNGLYGGILAALRGGNSAAAVESAVVSSPWGTKSINGAAGNPAASSSTTPVDQSSGVAVPVGWHIPGTPWDIPTPGDAVKGVEGAAAGLGRGITRTAIMLPLVLGGAALVVFGFIRTTNGLKGQPT